MTYIDQIAQLLNQCKANGMTNQEIATHLGLERPNYISMLISAKRHKMAPLSIRRIPALSKLCGLSAQQSLRLVVLRVKEHGKSRVNLDLETLKNIARWVCVTKAASDLRKGGLHGA